MIGSAASPSFHHYSPAGFSDVNHIFGNKLRQIRHDPVMELSRVSKLNTKFNVNFIHLPIEKRWGIPRHELRPDLYPVAA